MSSPQLTSTPLIPSRVRKLNQCAVKDSAGSSIKNSTANVAAVSAVNSTPVVYWMSRDQRVQDNWALYYAARRANLAAQPLWVVFCLVDSFLGAGLRQYHFMLSGLKEVTLELKDLNINFKLLIGEPEDKIVEFAEEIKAALIVCDFSPLKLGRSWRRNLAANASKINLAVHEVDAHNIVPVWHTSDKQEFAARTIRPKILKKLPEYLVEFSRLPDFSTSQAAQVDVVDVESLLKHLNVDQTVGKIDWLKPGSKAANQVLSSFVNNIVGYESLRNDPNQAKISNLSPYLHFGQISAQRVAVEIQKLPQPHQIDKQAFLEELIVRRELADNFCYYNQKYDNTAGFADWATKTLNSHRSDKREFIYTLAQFEQAQTHDQLWNASQLQMVNEGKMHGYMRMYWAKKILEWTQSPELAMEYAIFLNDKYELDGRDPNGYTGIAWSIGGIHDRPWFERPIFGLIRYMNASGASKKFNTQSYIQKYVQN